MSNWRNFVTETLLLPKPVNVIPFPLRAESDPLTSQFQLSCDPTDLTGHSAETAQIWEVPAIWAF